MPSLSTFKICSFYCVCIQLWTNLCEVCELFQYYFPHKYFGKRQVIRGDYYNRWCISFISLLFVCTNRLCENTQKSSSHFRGTVRSELLLKLSRLNVSHVIHRPLPVYYCEFYTITQKPCCLFYLFCCFKCKIAIKNTKIKWQTLHYMLVINI